ncbi:hypothetical protein HDV01_007133 [Terramyces sp. JEL0728]|nr:hypothetical protein HDV01_007133 [Terramyces sp. JEL0728]
MMQVPGENWSLPIEVWDRIWLLCDKETLKSTRELQSKYVKKTTEFFGPDILYKEGSLENMKWLLKNWALDTYKFSFAARVGNLENLKWLKKNNCPWNEYTFYQAANMKWLKENGCPWNEWTFSFAAKAGILETMKWLKENNCPWNESTFYQATENGNLANMEWLKENLIVKNKV